MDEAHRSPGVDPQSGGGPEALEVRGQGQARLRGARGRLTIDPTRLFWFVQWEFPGRLGPDPGRYLVRRFAGDDPRHVVVIGGLEAPRRWTRRRGPDPGTVEVTRATVIGADALLGRDAADAWLERAAGEDVVTPALAVLNEALHDFRVATADPYLVEVLPERALVTRIGYGSGDQVAEGRWEAARELPPPRPRPRREAALRPQERLAALLSGRDVALACEELALRARLDLDQGRVREAAMQLHLALEAGLAELQSWRNLPGMADRLAELAERREAVAVVRDAALQGGLDEEAHATVESALARLEAALRARTAAASF